MKMKKQQNKVFFYFLNFILMFFIFAFIKSICFIKIYFPNVYLSNIIFFLKYNIKGVDSNFVKTYIVSCVYWPVFFALLITFLVPLIKTVRSLYILLTKKKLFKKAVRYTSDNHATILFFTSLFVIYVSFLFTLFTNWSKIFPPKSSFYEQHYVSPSDQTFKFPVQKQNLIIIVAESLEKTFSNERFFETNLIEPLERIKSKGISFENYTNGYTTIATQPFFLALLAGVPTTIASKEIINIWGKNTPQLQNAYTLSDILTDNGYHTLFVGGMNTSFAGQKPFLQSHGFNEKYIDALFIREFYPNFKRAGEWGYQDKDIFEITKQELPKTKQPFFAIVNTIDTHQYYFPKIQAKKHFSRPEYDLIYNTSSHIADFINWLEKQTFFKNTTIIIIGDHLRDGNTLAMPDKRTIYNLFINSLKTPQTTDRTLTQIDLFPTVMESIGITWQNHKLGLGASVFSNEQTLEEKFGATFLAKELSKRNDLYDSLW